MLCTLFETFRGSFGLYEEHYVIPKEKYGVLTPLRSQDVVFIAAFFLVIAALFYVSYRLLKYAFGSDPPMPA
jgi:hypothetical protein